MAANYRAISAILLGSALALSAWGQQPTPEQNTAYDRGASRSSEPGPGRQVANGAGNIGAGAARGAGHLALGAGRAAGNLVTLHPIDAAGSAGRGAVAAGKDVGAGTAKGGFKIGKGIGRALKKLFRAADVNGVSRVVRELRPCRADVIELGQEMRDLRL